MGSSIGKATTNFFFSFSLSNLQFLVSTNVIPCGSDAHSQWFFQVFGYSPSQLQLSSYMTLSPLNRRAM